uniref:Uncharacterized protein n=1 Tax=Meloidogyne incognita TaxID=6306 RepID=A0A914L0L9_MELIC
MLHYEFLLSLQLWRTQSNFWSYTLKNSQKLISVRLVLKIKLANALVDRNHFARPLCERRRIVLDNWIPSQSAPDSRIIQIQHDDVEVLHVVVRSRVRPAYSHCRRSRC